LYICRLVYGAVARYVFVYVRDGVAGGTAPGAQSYSLLHSTLPCVSSACDRAEVTACGVLLFRVVETAARYGVPAASGVQAYNW
jgi:hypothetical protein